MIKYNIRRNQGNDYQRIENYRERSDEIKWFCYVTEKRTGVKLANITFNFDVVRKTWTQKGDKNIIIKNIFVTKLTWNIIIKNCYGISNGR